MTEESVQREGLMSPTEGAQPEKVLGVKDHSDVALITIEESRPVILKDEMKYLADRLAMQLPNMTRWAYGGRARAKVGLFVSRAKALAFYSLLAGVNTDAAVAVASSLVAAEPSRTEYRVFTERVSDLLLDIVGAIQ